MIAITSISPNHINAGIQQKAIDSWVKLGMEVYSINSKKECEILEPIYTGVKFLQTVRTMEKTYGRPHVNISAIIDACKEMQGDEFCIINSDIELTESVSLANVSKEILNNLVIANRINHNGDYKGNTYLAGFDVFFIHRRFLDLFPQSMHAMGMTFVDYFIPYTATQNGVQVVIIEQPFAYHLNHAAQYSKDMWLKSGRFFLWENMLYQFNDTKDVGKMSNFVYNYIYNSSVKKKI